MYFLVIFYRFKLKTQNLHISLFQHIQNCHTKREQLMPFTRISSNCGRDGNVNMLYANSGYYRDQKRKHCNFLPLQPVYLDPPRSVQQTSFNGFQSTVPHFRLPRNIYSKLSSLFRFYAPKKGSKVEQFSLVQRTPRRRRECPPRIYSFIF